MLRPLLHLTRGHPFVNCEVRPLLFPLTMLVVGGEFQGCLAAAWHLASSVDQFL